MSRDLLAEISALIRDLLLRNFGEFGDVVDGQDDRDASRRSISGVTDSTPVFKLTARKWSRVTVFAIMVIL